MRALAVFDGRAGHWLARFLRPGFKHCFAAIDDGRAWIVIDGRADLLAVSADIPSEFDLARFYRDAGFAVVETEVRRPPRRAAPAGPFTCVETVKRALGRHARVATPWQLYRTLKKEKDMTSLFSPPKPPSLPPLPQLPKEDDPEVEAARKRRRLAELKRRGRRATILTSGLGDSSAAPVNRPGLTNRLGGE